MEEEKKADILDEKELENIFNIKEPLVIHLTAKEKEIIDNNLNPKNIENFNNLLNSSDEGIRFALSNKPFSIYFDKIYTKYEKAKQEGKEDEMKQIQQDYARGFKVLKDEYDAKDRENNSLRDLFTNSAYRYAQDLNFINNVFNKNEDVSARVKQEIVDLKNKIYKNEINLTDASDYIHYLQSNKGKILQPKAYKTYTDEQLNHIYDILNSKKSKHKKAKDINEYLGKDVIEIKKSDGTVVDAQFKQFSDEIYNQKKRSSGVQLPTSNELQFSEAVQNFLTKQGKAAELLGGESKIDENGYPKKLNKTNILHLNMLFTKYKIPRPTHKFKTGDSEKYYENLKSYLKSLTYEEKELVKPLTSNKEQNMAESQDILDRIAKRQETASFLEKRKQKGSKIELEEKTLYFPNNEEDVDELKQIAEQGLLYEINIVSGRLRKVKPYQVKIGNEYVKFKVVGGAFAPGYAKNHILHSNDLGIGVHDKTMYNKIEDIPMTFKDFKEYKDKQMKGGSFFGKIWKSKIFDPLRSVKKDVVQSAKNISKSAVEIGKGKNIVGNLGNIGKNIGVGTVRALGDTSKFIQETPILKDINKQLTKVPGYGTALGVVENISRSGDALSKGKYGEAINQAAKTIPAIVGGSFTPLHSKHKLGNRLDPFSANKNAGTSADLYYGSIYNEEKVKRQNYFGSAYAPTSIQLAGGKPNYNVVSGPRNYEAPRDPWQEEDLGKNNKILRYDYIDPYKLPKFLAY